MARPGINSLPRPSAIARRRITRAGFESALDTRREDALRARRLSDSNSAMIDAALAANLADRLAESAEGGAATPTLASKRYMRRVRLRFTAALAHFIKRELWSGCVTFTAISWRWHLTPQELTTLDPKLLLKSFRADLQRSQADHSDGGLVAAIDVEFEPNRAIFVVHVHGVAFGAMIAALDGLRSRRKYRTVRSELPGLVPIYRPIMTRQLFLQDIERRSSYVLKSHWTSTWRGELGPDGKFRTARRSQRIPEPYHSLALLWLDRQSLQDITLLIGVEAGSFGFRRTSSRQRGPRGDY